MNVSEAVRYCRRRLLAVSEEADTEARLLIARLTGESPGAAAVSFREFTEAERLEKLLDRRLSGEPLQYVLGEWSFMGLNFAVTPDALIPRQDTETLCEEALRLIDEAGFRSLLDICTGTGCIAISIKKLSKRDISAEASDISSDALALAKKNAEINGADILFREADLFEGAGSYDLVTANPPYIPDADMLSLQKELRYEPRLALAGGADGLDLYRRIAAEAPAHINRGGALLMEVGIGEAEPVAAMFPGNEVGIIKDLNGVERVVRVRF